MSVTYSIGLYTPLGARLTDLPALNFSYTLSVAQIGSLTVEVPPSLPASYYGRDFQIEVRRSVDGGVEQLEGSKRWLIRKIRKTFADANTLTLQAVCPNDLLRRRVVAYDADTAFTSKTGAADNLIKAIARENMTTGITGARDVPGSISAYLAVQADEGLGATLSIACARDNVLETCRKICEASITAGIYLAFDIIWNGFGFELQTFTQQRGSDHRYAYGISPVLLGQEFGSLTDVELLDDYTDETTVVIGGAQGVGSSRTIATATDTTRLSASPLNQCEVFYQGNSVGYDPVALTDLADGRLRAGRPRRILTGRVAETPGVQYGRDWAWGDRVTVQAEEQNYDARIDSVTISVSGGRETIDAGIRIDG